MIKSAECQKILKTWVNGSNAIDQAGVYGTKGIAHSNNIPGARYGSISWIDLSNNFWIFGGRGRDGTGNIGALNDLGKFDGTNWTWVSGSSSYNQTGIYGTKGVANENNAPGGRDYSTSWVDESGNFWLFGGLGMDSVGGWGDLNDLWKFDGTNWTWVSGANTLTSSRH